MTSKKLLSSLALLAIASGLAAALLYWIFAPKQDSSVTQHWRLHQPESQLIVDHTLWQSVLDDYLITDDESGVNLFDYAGLIDDENEQLAEYIHSLSNLNPRELNRAEQFAYWVNLYNALTVQLIIENYPIDSIREIGDSPLPTGPWNDPAVEINGHSLTLNHIEHSILRPIWQDHRIHFAVNCASIGCPDLQQFAFTADNTETLLNASAQAFLSHPRGFNLNNDTLTLSSIFDWYGEDFGDSKAAVIYTLKQHLSPESLSALKTFEGSVSYQYNWQLNQAH